MGGQKFIGNSILYLEVYMNIYIMEKKDFGGCLSKYTQRMIRYIGGQDHKLE